MAPHSGSYSVAGLEMQLAAKWVGWLDMKKVGKKAPLMVS